MKNKIKKIKNLEELNRLKIGEVIQSYDDRKIVNLVYEGVDRSFNNRINFLEIPNSENLKIIFERSYDLKYLKFNKGMITQSLYLPLFYRNNNKNQEKLNLIKGVLN